MERDVLRLIGLLYRETVQLTRGLADFGSKQGFRARFLIKLLELDVRIAAYFVLSRGNKLQILEYLHRVNTACF